MKIKDNIPVDPAAELSLDNILTNIRFRGQNGFKLVDYTFTDGNATVVLDFESIDTTPSSPKPRTR